MPIHRPPPHLKLSPHHQRPAGMKTPQPHSSIDAALHILAELSPQTLSRVRSTSTLPKIKGQTPTHSLLRHECSYRIVELLQPLRVSTGIAIPPASSKATSIKWPQEGSSMRCSQPTHRHLYSKGQQQQWCQSLPQRGPPQSGVHSWTPSRSPSRQVSPLLIPPCS